MNLQNQIEYLKQFHNQDMFDECSVPAGLDMQRVRGAIIMRCGLMWPLFSEPETQRMATQQFFAENQWNFEHILNILNAEYSPIENVAEVREEKTVNGGRDTLTINRNSTEAHSGTDGRVVQESGTEGDQETGSTTTTREVSAENATTYQADNKETVQHGRGNSTTFGKRTADDLQHGHTIAHGGSDQHVNEKDSNTSFSVNRHGNVGITSNQELINQELDLLERFNPYKFIADMYEKELMLGLY